MITYNGSITKIAVSSLIEFSTKEPQSNKISSSCTVPRFFPPCPVYLIFAKRTSTSVLLYCPGLKLYCTVQPDKYAAGLYTINPDQRRRVVNIVCAIFIACILSAFQQFPPNDVPTLATDLTLSSLPQTIRNTCIGINVNTNFQKAYCM